ncbi:MAG: hypothetical protein ACUVRK_12380, partial [Spirochaetota bacterium]
MKNFLVTTFVIVFFATNGCSKKGVREGNFVCTVHGIHNCYDKAQMAQCIGVDEKTMDEYYLFSELGNGDSFANESKLKSLVCDKIVDEVMLRIQMIYSDKHFQRWQFTDMSLPVIFRTFVKKGSRQKMVVIGFIKKEDMSPKAIIYY